MLPSLCRVRKGVCTDKANLVSTRPLILGFTSSGSRPSMPRRTYNPTYPCVVTFVPNSLRTASAAVSRSTEKFARPATRSAESLTDPSSVAS